MAKANDEQGILDFMEERGADSLSEATKLLQDALTKYKKDNAEKKLGMNFMVNGMLTLSMSQLNHIMKTSVEFSQTIGFSKAEIYALRKELSENIHRLANDILEDEWYKYEEHML